MPPRRRTFYLADATVLSNGKVRRLSRKYPDEWLAAWGAFHLLIGVATLNGSPRLTADDVIDTLGPENEGLATILQEAGLLSRTGIDPVTFRDWCPKPRPRYPSDSRGVDSDSDGISTTPAESRRIPRESPTSSTSSTSSTGSTTPSTPRRSAGVAQQPAPKGAAALVDYELPEHLRAVQ